MENRIDLIHIQDHPLNQYELRVQVLDQQVTLPRGLTHKKVDEQWKKLVAEKPDRENLRRFFLKSIAGNELSITKGNYSHFLATRELKMQELAKKKPNPYRIEEF